jgi:hypothetical protein
MKIKLLLAPLVLGLTSISFAQDATLLQISGAPNTYYKYCFAKTGNTKTSLQMSKILSL